MHTTRQSAKQTHSRLRTAAAKITTALSTFVLLASVGFPAVQAHADAVATVIAGQPSDGPLVNDIPATQAQFWNPSNVVTTADGTIYVADKNHNEIRSIGADGVIHAAFGDGTPGCATNSDMQSELYSPSYLAVDGQDHVYTTTGCGQIVEFTPGNPTGTVVAGRFDGTGNPNPFTHDGMAAKDVTMMPGAMAYDSINNVLYFSDSNARILALQGGVLTTYAGTGTAGFSGDGGQATSAQISNAGGLAFADGNLYFSDGNNCRVRMVAADGTISTLAGTGDCQDQNTTGPGAQASIQYPGPLTLDANGMLYIAGGQSGTVFAYDTQAKTIAPVIGIISGDTGLAMDKDGNLLALHSGVNQQLYRITGLPSPTPPADGKQHGRVTGVSWDVGSATPLWNMDATLKTTGVSCPAVAAVSVGGWQKRVSLCGAGQNSPKTTNFTWKVFNDKHSFQPGSTPVVSAFVVKSDAAHYGGGTTTLTVPGLPALVGVGDSYISGHHQIGDNVTCVRADNAPSSDTSCNLFANDPDFSWVTHLADKLDVKAPLEWFFDYDKSVDLLAQSGATTGQITGQIPGMQAILQQHPHTWNVVAFDGGGNDVGLQKALSDLYHVEPLTKPWDEKFQSDCPDSEAVYQKLFGAFDGGGVQSNIQSNLQAVIAAGRATPGTPRFLDMLYPYITKTSNVCAQDHTGLLADSVWHGSVSVINGLDDIHRGLAAPDVLTLDLSKDFGNNPLGKIQQFRYYGYPHPNEDGQNKIAQQAAKLLR